MTVGLDLRGAFEDGMVFGREVLAIDTDQIRGEVARAAQQAFNLAMFAWLPTATTAVPLVARAQRQAMALATKVGYISRATAPALLQQAKRRALVLASLVARTNPQALDDDLMARLAGAAPPATPAPASREEKKAEPGEEKVSEEEAAAGLGALFG